MCTTLLFQAYGILLAQPRSGNAQTGIVEVMQTQVSIRRRGPKPQSISDLTAKVDASVRALRATGVPFTIQDVADHSGISRASLYRIEGLRDRIGVHGDQTTTRPINARELKVLRKELESVREERSAAVKENRRLQIELNRAVRRIDELMLDGTEKSQAAKSAEQKAETAVADRDSVYAEGFQAGLRAASQKGRGMAPAAGSEDLNVAAARLPRAAMLKARRTLALAIHPDLFQDNPAAQVLAGEIFKLLNQLATPGQGPSDKRY
jgi:regulator of replication initiation timing